MSKVLIIARRFPPYYHSLGGVLRALKLADYLQGQGVEVFVLAGEGVEISYFGYRELVQSLDVTYIPDPLQRAFNRKKLQALSAQEMHDETAKTRFPFRPALRRLCRPLLIPDPGVLLTLRYYRAARRMLQKHDIPNVIITSPPHSIQLVGPLLKRHFKNRIRLTVDYRDSWNCRGLFCPKTHAGRMVSECLERNVLRAADRFTCVSEPIMSKISRKFFDIGPRTDVVMNGFDRRMAPPAAEVADRRDTPDMLTLGLFGRVTDRSQEGRDPTTLLETVATEDLPVRIVFHGHVEVNPCWSERLGNRLVLGGNLDHAAALKRMQQMDVLLILVTDEKGSDEVVTGRIFEYMLTNRPILVVGPKDMAAGRIVEAKGLGYHFSHNDKRELADGLRQLVRAREKGELPVYDWEDIAEFDRSYQYAKVLQHVL